MAAEQGGYGERGVTFWPLTEMEAVVHRLIKPLTTSEQTQVEIGQVWTRRAIWDEGDGQMVLSRNTTQWGKDYWELYHEDTEGVYGIRQHPYSVTGLQARWPKTGEWEDVQSSEHAEFQAAFEVAIAGMPDAPKIEDIIAPMAAAV